MADPATVATGSDMTQPADKKERTREPTASSTKADHSSFFNKLHDGTKLNLLPQFSTFTPIAELQFLELNTESMADYFMSLRSSILRGIYPDGNYVDANVITAPNFVLVCRLYMLARADYVYSAVNGTLLANRRALPLNAPLPACLATLINGVGLAESIDPTISICPQPEAIPNANPWPAQVTGPMREDFARLVMDASHKNVIRIAYMSTEIKGSHWWTLGVYDLLQPADQADETEHVEIRSCYTGPSPLDCALAAIVQQHQTGMLPMLFNAAEATTTVYDALELRQAYNLAA